MEEKIKYKIIDTMRSLGLEKINKEEITRNNILDIVSSHIGISRQDIKRSVNYKKVISDELGKMEEDDDSDNEPLSIIVDRMQSLKLGKSVIDMDVDSGDSDNEDEDSDNEDEDSDNEDEDSDNEDKDSDNEDEDSDNEDEDSDNEDKDSDNEDNEDEDSDNKDSDNEYGGAEETKETDYIEDTIDEDVFYTDFNPQNRDILNVGGIDEPIIADWLSTKDLVNLTAVNKATRKTAIREIKQRQEILELNEERTIDYFYVEKYRTYINGALRKYNKKLSLQIPGDQQCFLDLDDIPQLRISLQSLKLLNVKCMTDLVPLENLTNLQNLEIYDMEDLNDISVLENLTNLQSLILRYCSDILYDISDLEKLTKLQSLELTYLEKLTDITPLEKLTNLQSLELKYLTILTDISPLENLTNLQSLDLTGLSPSITDIKPIEKLTRLQSLKLIDLPNLDDIKHLKKLRNLQSLELRQLENLTNITHIGNLTNLQSLELHDLKNLTDISVLENLTNLQSLKLGYLPKLDDLTPLKKLRRQGVKVIHYIDNVEKRYT